MTMTITPADGFVESQSAVTWEPTVADLRAMTPAQRVIAAEHHVRAGRAPEDFAAMMRQIRHIGGAADRTGRPIPPPPVLGQSFGADATSAREARRIAADEHNAARERTRAALAPQGRPVNLDRLMRERTSTLNSAA